MLKFWTGSLWGHMSEVEFIWLTVLVCRQLPMARIGFSSQSGGYKVLKDFVASLQTKTWTMHKHTLDTLHLDCAWNQSCHLGPSGLLDGSRTTCPTRAHWCLSLRGHIECWSSISSKRTNLHAQGAPTLVLTPNCQCFYTALLTMLI